MADSFPTTAALACDAPALADQAEGSHASLMMTTTKSMQGFDDSGKRAPLDLEFEFAGLACALRSASLRGVPCCLPRAHGACPQQDLP